MNENERYHAGCASAAEGVEDTQKGTITVLHGDAGKTTIHKAVVAQIADLAVRDVKGVHKILSFSPMPATSSLTSAFRKGGKKSGGVQVEVGEKETAVDVRIIAEFGASIPTIAHEIRTSLVEKIYDMTGLRVVEVNIEVSDLYFPMEDGV